VRRRTCFLLRASTNLRGVSHPKLARGTNQSSFAKARRTSYARAVRVGWWSQTGSNRRPEACKATALPTELWPRSIPVSVEAVVGPDRFELSTPRLSSVCSNQLSYGPSPANGPTRLCADPATGLVLSTTPARIASEARVKEKRNEDGGEPLCAFKAEAMRRMSKSIARIGFRRCPNAIDP
jgi:hypothetical protein